MLQTLKNAWKIPELRKKLLFTLFILLIYRLGSVIPVPFIDVTTLANYFDSVLSSTILGLYNAMSGSAFSRATVLALGIQPYINASIIIQLLTVAIPALERLAKDGGEDGKKKIERITRYTTVGLGLLMGWAYYMMLRNYSSQISIITSEGLLPALVIILAFTAGSALVMWLGEQITEFGIGNGISMILFANIISSIPGMVGTLATLVWWQILIVLVGIVALVLFIVFINDAERRIPIQYAKRVVGRKVYGGQNTNLPIKVAMSGVMPIIFAQSICSLPATICAFTGKTSGWWYDHVWSSSSWIYAVIYFIMIFFFSWFYSTIQYDTVEISNNLKSNGGFIPGFRPGKPTADFIQKVINKIVQLGARVVNRDNAAVHVSGHCNEGELLYMYNIVKPKCAMPIHGENRHLVANGMIAVKTGVDPQNVVLAEDGDVVDLYHGQAAVVGSVPCGYVYVDGDSVGELTDEELEKRRILGTEGFVSSFVVVDTETADVITGPKIYLNAVAEDESEFDKVRHQIVEQLQDAMMQGTRDTYKLQQIMRRTLGGWVARQLHRKPMIVPVVADIAQDVDDAMGLNAAK